MPLVLDRIRPERIVDVGCGRGTWLRVAAELGVSDITGMDGDYVARDTLLIPPETFVPTDLSRPFRIPQRYDLAMCMEVAEHLPKRAAGPLVDTLTCAAPAVLFSAAIPGQTGQRHINEQFPEFWWRHFRERSYLALDAVRPFVAWNRSVEPWYAQNTLLYVSRSYYDSNPRLHDLTPIEEPTHLLPWVSSGIWRGRLRWRGLLSLTRLMLRQTFS